MLKYNITECKGGKLITVSCNDLLRWALHDTNDIPLKFNRIGNEAAAIATTPVKLYKKPNLTQHHKEYMLHNSRSLWQGFTPQFDRLARNLYEYMGMILDDGTSTI